MKNLQERKVKIEEEIAKLQAELAEVSAEIEVASKEENSYAKFEVGKSYYIILSSYSNKKSIFICEGIKEGKVKGSMDGKTAKWYDLVLQKKLRNGELCEVYTEAIKPDKRVSSYVKAVQKM